MSRRLEELAEVVQHEVGVLQLVDLVGAAHHPGRFEGQALDVAAFDGVLHFLGRGQDSGAVDLQALGGADQAELDRVPIERAQEVDVRAGVDRALAVALHVVGKDRIAEQRHVAEEIVEQVGLDQVVELGTLAQPHRHRKPPVREMVVEHGVRDQAGHADHAPAGQRREPGVHRVEIGNAVADAQVSSPAGIRRRQVLGQRRLSLDQKDATPHDPRRIEVEVLRHGPIRRHAGVVAAEAFDGGERLHDRIWGDP
jgi:hypothetical protein